MQEYIDAGYFDVAVFDAENSRELHLEVSRRVFSPDSPADCSIVIANYLMDTLISDIFRLGKGGIKPGLTTTLIKPKVRESETDIVDQKSEIEELHYLNLREVTYGFSFERRGTKFYRNAEDEDLNTLLHNYQDNVHEVNLQKNS